MPINDTPQWYKTAVFYEVYVRAFFDSNDDGHGDLPGLTSRLDYIKDLGIDCIWLLPIYPSPLKDDGYDIADYYSIHPDYGTLDDFREFVEAAHNHGIRVITDLVLNHTSDQHPWFQAARQSPHSKYRNYYVWSNTNKKYRDARIIFLDTEKSNWTWDEVAGQYYWHRFYASQPDLNYDNPEVQQEMLKVMEHWLKLGVDGFRVDAVPYLYEREGTNCENLPETHAYIKKLRRFIDKNYPGRILLCEANQRPEDVLTYFGNGDEFHIGFHFPLMPRIFMALKKENNRDLKTIIQETPAIPESCQWCTFLRNHDELTLEMVTSDERKWMWETFAPEPRMRLNLGIRRRLAPLLGNDRKMIELANSILFTMMGTPILYYGDEVGMGENILLKDRNGVRTPMQWNASSGAGFSRANPADFYLPVIDDPEYGFQRVNVEEQQANPFSLLNNTKRMIAIYKTHKALGKGNFIWYETGTPSILAYMRTWEDETILVFQNLSHETHLVSLSDEITRPPRILLPRPNHTEIRLVDSKPFRYRMSGHAYLWLIL